jgi:hypothetical protein
MAGLMKLISWRKEIFAEVKPAVIAARARVFATISSIRPRPFSPF